LSFASLCCVDPWSMTALALPTGHERNEPKTQTSRN
jgi:hypothetical protein